MPFLNLIEETHFSWRIKTKIKSTHKDAIHSFLEGPGESIHLPSLVGLLT